MVDEITQLKTQLAELNTKCQLARDNEVRFALQRGRLEAERTQLVVKMMEAMASQATPTPATPPEVNASPYRVVVGSQEPTSSAPPRRTPPRRTPKPEGTPTVTEMVATAIQALGKPSRPVEITTYINGRWWPGVTTQDVGPVVWRMAQGGRLSHSGGRYGLNGARSNGADHSSIRSPQA
jgi:hypothetical protein